MQRTACLPMIALGQPEAKGSTRVFSSARLALLLISLGAPPTAIVGQDQTYQLDMSFAISPTDAISPTGTSSPADDEQPKRNLIRFVPHGESEQDDEDLAPQEEPIQTDSDGAGASVEPSSREPDRTGGAIEMASFPSIVATPLEATASPTMADFTYDDLDIDAAAGPSALPCLSCSPGPCPTRCCWVRAEYLLWWVEGFQVPSLVTNSPAGTDREAAGVLGETSTTVLLGNTRLADGSRSGGRIRFGYWLDPCANEGIEASCFALANRTSDFRADSGSVPILARPFNNFTPGFEEPAAELIAFPQQLDGSISVRGETAVYGAEAHYRRAICRSCNYRCDFLAGWRYSRLDEELLISDFKRVIAGDTGLQVGTTLEEFDRFEASNSFQGAQLGVVGQWYACKWNLELLMKLALGNTHARTTIDGSTTVTVPDPDIATTPAGLLALPTNIGSYSTDQLAVIPELGITLGYNLTSNLRATLNYSFMYWSWVARPGDPIDLDLNLSQLDEAGLVGPARPEFTWVDTDVWLQGLGIGLGCRF